MRWSNKAKADYENLFRTMKIKSSRMKYVRKAAAKAMKHKRAYTDVAKQIGCPWEFIAAIHMRESNAHFGGVLHNGERIIGRHRKTKLVPRGRGPFVSWEEAAIDALELKRLHKIDDWSDGRVCFELERYNGWGYRGRGKSKRSPYLWAGTNHQKAGKYIADGKYSSKAWDKQLGALPVLKMIRQLDAPHGELTKKSRRFGLMRTISRFLEWMGLTGVTGWFTFGNLERVTDFATDTRTLTFLAVGVTLYIAVKVFEYMSLREYRDGRYIPSEMEDLEEGESEDLEEGE